MTSIGAVKVRNGKLKPGEKGTEYIVCIADTQSTVLQGFGGSKTEGAKKLSRIGKDKKHIVMGTGRADQIENVTQQLQDAKIKELTDALQLIANVTGTLKFGKRDGLGFILAGINGKEGLDIARIDCKARSHDIGRMNYFEGSGSFYINKYFEAASDVGIYFPNRNLTDAVSLMFNCAIRGARDLGVNDKLQWGIISEHKVATLYHPEIEMYGKESTRYLTETLGVELPEDLDATYSQEKKADERIKLIEQVGVMHDVLERFYYAWYSELSDHMGAQRHYTGVAAAYGIGDMTLRELQWAKKQKAMYHQRVKNGLEVLLEQGAPKILDFLNEYYGRTEEMAAKLTPT
jgi:hypothetical protein